MYLVPLLDHLRRNARCLVVVALALIGAFILPLQVSAAGASEGVAATSTVPASPVVPVPEPAPAERIKPIPAERIKPIPAEPVCSPAVATCDDVTTDPCAQEQDCEPPPPPPCEEGVISRSCPQPPCEEEGNQENRLDCPPPCEEDPEQECPVPPCEPEGHPRLRQYPENPDHPWNPDCPPEPCDPTHQKHLEEKRIEGYPECPPCYPKWEEKHLEEKRLSEHPEYPECPPPCDSKDYPKWQEEHGMEKYPENYPKCPPHETDEPDPGVDRPVPGTPNFTG